MKTELLEIFKTMQTRLTDIEAKAEESSATIRNAIIEYQFATSDIKKQARVAGFELSELLAELRLQEHNPDEVTA